MGSNEPPKRAMRRGWCFAAVRCACAVVNAPPRKEASGPSTAADKVRPNGVRVQDDEYHFLTDFCRAQAAVPGLARFRHFPVGSAANPCKNPERRGGSDRERRRWSGPNL